MTNERRLAVLTRMFSSSVFRSLGARGSSALLARLLQDAGESFDGSSGTVADALQRAFDILRRTGNRDDYVYRSAIIQKLFIARHSFRTATPLLEARSGASRADVVILNGTSTAYEIKSERDSTSRLHNQVLDYRQVWATVNVVTSLRQAQDIRRLVPSDVGILVLTDRFSLRVEKEAITVPERISPTFLLDALRVEEAHAVLEMAGAERPRLPNTVVRSYLRAEFSRLDPTTAHNFAVETLKRSRSRPASAARVKELPPFLRAASMSQHFGSDSYDKLHTALATPLPQALTWS